MLVEAKMRTHYERLGGEETIRRLVARFYEIMDELPEAYGIRKMHAGNLEDIGQKLVEFLSGWTGGPQLYVEKYGHPRLRQRHLPFAIGVNERNQWMMCMQQALQETVPDEALQRELMQAFAKVGDHMRNQTEKPVGQMTTVNETVSE